MVVNDNGKLKFCFWFDSHARETTTRGVGTGRRYDGQMKRLGDEETPHGGEDNVTR